MTVINIKKFHNTFVNSGYKTINLSSVKEIFESVTINASSYKHYVDLCFDRNISELFSTLTISLDIFSFGLN